MKLTTQDGRTIELSRDYHLFIGGYLKGNGHKANIKVATFTKSKWEDVPWSEHHKYPDYKAFDSEIVQSYGVVGEYATNTGRKLAAEALDKAFKSGVDEFAMPQDTFTASEHEQLEDFCEKHGLTMLCEGEPGYNPKERAECKRLARETDYWERNGCLVSDGHGDYSKSLAKWKALNPDNAA